MEEKKRQAEKMGDSGNLAIADRPAMLAIDDEMPPPPPGPPPEALSTGNIDDEGVQELKVERVQLQRMLDEDEILREICQTDKAIDVVRRFRVEQAEIDPYDAVAKLQHQVAQMISSME